MSWAQMVRKVLARKKPLRFTEIVNRVAALCEKQGFDYEPIQVKGSVARTLGNGLKDGTYTRPERGVYVLND